MDNTQSPPRLSDIWRSSFGPSPLSHLTMRAFDDWRTWEERSVRWIWQNAGIDGDEYLEVLKAYTAMGDYLAQFSGCTPVEATPFYTIQEDKPQRYATLKESLEDLTGVSLPNIRPLDAMELGRMTRFSAEEWYRGCTDRREWDTFL